MARILVIVGAVVIVIAVVVAVQFTGGDDADVADADRSATSAQGGADGGAVSREGEPSFDIVRVERDGNAVIAGRAKAGQRVVILGGDEVIGEAVASESGEWVLVLDKPLEAGEVEIRARTEGADASVSSQVVTIAVPKRADQRAIVVLSQPGESTRVLQGSGVVSETGNLLLETVDYDEDGNVVFAGRSDPQASVRAYLNNGYIGEGRADAKGRWDVRPTVEIEPRTYRLRIDQLDSAGSVVARITIPFERATRAAILRAQRNREGKVTIQPGDNLWTISRHLYGKGDLFTVIFEANTRSIDDPNLIYPGQIFDAPTTR